MNQLSPELERQVLQSAMQQKILCRAAELVAMGWTRGTAARDAHGQKVRSTANQATAWCVVGAVDRALYELLNVEVYDLLGLDVEGYDTATCALEVMCELRRPLQTVLGHGDLATWNDDVCPGPAAAERLLREAAARVDPYVATIDTVQPTVYSMSAARGLRSRRRRARAVANTRSVCPDRAPLF